MVLLAAERNGQQASAASGPAFGPHYRGPQGVPLSNRCDSERLRACERDVGGAGHRSLTAMAGPPQALAGLSEGGLVRDRVAVPREFNYRRGDRRPPIGPIRVPRLAAW
jgi:hypothetical protein